MSETRERAGAVRHAFAVEDFKSVIREAHCAGSAP